MTIPAGATSTTIVVTPIDDALAEWDETIALSVNYYLNNAYAVGTPSAATVTIHDNEPVLSVEATDPTAAEQGGDPATFTVRRAGSLANAVTVYYYVGGSATPVADYSGLPNYTSYGYSGTYQGYGSVVIPAGSASQTITLTPVDDALIEGDETILLAVSADQSPPAHYTVGSPSTAQATIAENDFPSTVTLVATDPDAAERGSDPATFTLSRANGNPANPVTVYYTVTGTAKPGVDYMGMPNYADYGWSGYGVYGSGSVTIPAYATQASFSIAPINDSLSEGNEGVEIDLSNSSGYVLGSPNRATATIADDDAVVSIAATDADAAESGPDPGTFTVTRQGGDFRGPLTVSYAVGGTATNGVDDAPLSGTVTIPANWSTATIQVNPVDDSLQEADEAVIATLSPSSSYAVGTPSAATVTILDNDTVVSIVATDPVAAEQGPDPATFTIGRTGSTASALTVNYTVGGSATNGLDYTGLPAGYWATATIPAGAASTTLTVTPIDDSLGEGDETVVLALSGASRYRVAASASGTATIADNEPPVTIVATDPDAAEQGSDPATFTLTRGGPTAAPLTVTYTVGGTATNGTDYQALSGSVTFAAGSSTTTVTVTPVDDSVSEPPEVVYLQLKTGPYQVVSPGGASVNIRDNDTVVSIGAFDPNASERGLDPGVYAVIRTGGDPLVPVTVTYMVSGEATPDADYVALTGSVTIPAQVSTAYIYVTPIDDSLPEPSERVIATLSAGAGYAVGSANAATVTIVDDDTVVGVVATDPDAAEQGSDPGIFTVSRTGPTTAALTVNYTVGGTATPGADYTGLSSGYGGTVTIPAGAASTTLTITPIDDSVGEYDETAILWLSTADTPGAYSIGPAGNATVTIADNDPVVSIVATDPDASERGLDPGVFTVTRVGPTTSMLVVNYSIFGSATAGSDYQSLPGSVTIPAGSSSATILVMPLHDTLGEGDETVAAALGTGSYRLGSPAQATVTIADDEPLVSLTASDPNAAEAGGDTATFVVGRDGGDLSTPLTVAYTVGGSATPGADYAALPGTVTIAAGATTATIVVTPAQDSLGEGDETVVLWPADGPYRRLAGVSATATIADDEPVLSIVATDPSAAEQGLDPATFTVTRDGSTSAPLLVTYSVGGSATPGADYAPLPGSVTIPAGSASATIVVAPVDDAISESAETVTVALGVGAGYTVPWWGAAQASATIADNDPVLTVATDYSGASVAEGSRSPARFVVSRGGGDLSVPLRITYTVGGTATANADYVALSGSVTIPAGATSATLPVQPIDDTQVEPTETVVLTLIAAAGFALGNPRGATISITDDDTPAVAPPQISLVATDPSASEAGPDTGSFTLTRTGDVSQPLTVSVSVGGTATLGTDYTLIPAPDGGWYSYSITFPAGSSTAALVVSPIDDSLAEPSETAWVALLYGTGYTVGAASTATVTIADNDPPPPTVSVSATDPTAAEPGTDTGTFTFTRAGGNLSAPLTARYSVGGSATPGSDYTALSGTVTFAAGSSTATALVAPIDDALAEGDETVVLWLGTDPAYLPGTSTAATVTIADNEPTVSLTATDPSAAEQGLDPATFTVTRTGSTAAPLTVYYAIGGTATADADYRGLPGVVTIAAGSAAATIVVTPVDDVASEPDESVQVSLSVASAYRVDSPSTATATIADNDPSVTLAATDPDAAEAGGNTGAFTFTRIGSLGSPLTVYYSVGGTATPLADYSGLPNYAGGAGSVTFPAGSSTQTVVVTPVDDALPEADETVVLRLTPDTTYRTPWDYYGSTVTIADNDPQVSVQATDPSASETNLDPGTFTFTRTGDTAVPLTVSYAVSGTATADADYARLTGAVVFAVGVSSVTLPVVPIDDSTPEAAESVTVTLLAGAYLAGSPTTASVTIADDDLLVDVSATDPNAAEQGIDPGTFTITRSGPTTAPLTISYSLGGTATAGADYVTPAGSSTYGGGHLTIPAGSSTATLAITPIDDSIGEDPETVVFNMQAGTGYRVGLLAADTVTIADNDPGVSIQATDPDAAEQGVDPGTFTVTRTGSTASPLAVVYTLGGTAAAGLDYTAPAGFAGSTGRVTIPAGSANATITVAPIDDALAEGPESVVASLAAGPYRVLSPWTASLTIADNEPTVSLTATDPSAAEAGPDAGTFTVTRNGGSTAAPLTVYYSTSYYSSATADVDYVGLPGVVTIPAGAASATIVVTPIDDIVGEADETVVVGLSAATAYLAAPGSTATVTIADNDPTVSITASDPSAAEAGPDPGAFTVSRSGSTASALTVFYAVGGSATSALDYAALAGSVVIPAGASTATFAVAPIDDALGEGPETVVASLAPNPLYRVGSGDSATVTIADNEPTVSLTATDPSAAEQGLDPATFTVTRTGSTASPLTVAYSVGGSATPGADYGALSGTVVISAGSATATIVVAPIDDAISESAESVTVGLAAGAYLVGTPGSASAVIADNDSVVSISPPYYGPSEAGPTAARPRRRCADHPFHDRFGTDGRRDPAVWALARPRGTPALRPRRPVSVRAEPQDSEMEVGVGRGTLRRDSVARRLGGVVLLHRQLRRLRRDLRRARRGDRPDDVDVDVDHRHPVRC